MGFMLANMNIQYCWHTMTAKSYCRICNRIPGCAL